MELGLFQKDILIEKLAKAFYRIQGYVIPESYRMQDATHPLLLSYKVSTNTHRN
ncbi:hypothetical protein [Nodularia spumigena]|jgi:hypothetical protein|uniref:Uncharacterized protein n=1 Tax=Nodularia spumigena UHCC 0060 TaxID=3110300 RepID=A0ABU5UVI6_NODSP|nr:hypothetical protein [Nodularia spumigena]MEA5527320.1 hypothetical protein [Nodularia spumigena UHCC 0143]MEA5609555.1 hypothetical protein [Nodularia spumigena UHCC 0060]